MFDRYPVLNLSEEGKLLVRELNRDMAESSLLLHSYPCISCKGEKRKTIFSNDAYGLNQKTVMCLDCGMVYSDPRMQPESLDRFYNSDTYRLLYDTYSSKLTFIEAANNKIAAASSLELKPFANESYDVFKFYSFLNKNVDLDELDIVCEIGAGSGANLIPFLQDGKKVLGVELSQELALNAKKHGIDLGYASIEKIDRKVDLFLLIHSLEHLHDPICYLRKLVAFEPRYILIEVPGIVSRMPGIQNAHNFYFSINTLLKVASYAGLSCINVQRIKQNDFILGVFRIDKDAKYEYDHRKEIQAIRKIEFIQKLKNLIPISLKTHFKKLLVKSDL